MRPTLKRSVTLHLPVKLIEALQAVAASHRISPSALVTAMLKLPLRAPKRLPVRDVAKVIRHCSVCGQEFSCYAYQRYKTCNTHRGKHRKGFVEQAYHQPLSNWKETDAQD